MQNRMQEVYLVFELLLQAQFYISGFALNSTLAVLPSLHVK